MAFKKGQVANPRGRPKGSKNRVSKEMLTAFVSGKKKLPLDFLLEVMASDKTDIFTKIDVAKAALPYCHRKQPQMVEMEGSVTHTGVMVVPDTPDAATWSERAAKAQAQLKAEVRH